MSIRPADAGDDDFILAFAGRLAAVPLPEGRHRDSITRGIHTDLDGHLRERPAHSHFFVIEDAGERAGFAHLQLVDAFFGGGLACHISHFAVAPGHEGRGLAGRQLEHSEQFARAHGCFRLTLAVFPGNERARALYERHRFGVDLVRMGKPLPA